MRQKILLFDADGVLTIPEEFFSVVYARSQGLNPEPFESFFKTEWQDFVTGKRDIKKHIQSTPELWQWNGTPEELVDYWCKTEDIRNNEMLALIRVIRASGTNCYLATEQEKYRGEYMKNVMFKNLFDDYFVTAELGLKKNNPLFFKKIIESLNRDGIKVEPSDIIFIDDSQSKVDAAIETGIDGRLFKNVESFKNMLSIEGILRE